MNKKIDNIKRFRLYLLKQISSLTTEQLNEIPKGCNNNMIWNIAHLISAMQVICYVRADLPVAVNDNYVTPFLPGTKPEKYIDKDEVKAIKELFITSTDKLQTDVDNNIFGNYSTSLRIKEVYDVDVHNIEDAIEFLLYHEGFHIGYMMSLKHLL